MNANNCFILQNNKFLKILYKETTKTIPANCIIYFFKKKNPASKIRENTPPLVICIVLKKCLQSFSKRICPGNLQNGNIVKKTAEQIAIALLLNTFDHPAQKT